MITPINYDLNRAELIGTLRLLSSFIVIQKMENDEDDDKSEIMLPEPYFYDKVTFVLCKAHASLSVLTKEGVRVERTCNIISVP